MNRHVLSDQQMDEASQAARPDARRGPAMPSRIVTSESLFRGLHEIGIDHDGLLYRLKITRQGKLILNK